MQFKHFRTWKWGELRLCSSWSLPRMIMIIVMMYRLLIYNSAFTYFH
jgi:hypothetical protein